MNTFYHLVETLGPAIANYEEAVKNFFATTIKPGWSVIDVGSHVGAHTITMANLLGENGQVVAFDAHSQNTEDLLVNATPLVSRAVSTQSGAQSPTVRAQK